ncbi:MAG: hypothetical protein KJO44_03270 [Gemmatimonadetes bacterium]|nr:hypothetical protein [Gemmatimonadota bacterium]MBT8478831.1 hypothetical protein [Gemmatimonadota bacterium]NNK48380.1 hypothetical protein [Gemmatimonadota bacterium]
MMNLNPKLGRTERVTNVAVGAALIVSAFLGLFDKMPLRVLIGGLGLVFVVGGFGGT